jgi:hypothetical protein
MVPCAEETFSPYHAAIQRACTGADHVLANTDHVPFSGPLKEALRNDHD